MSKGYPNKNIKYILRIKKYGPAFLGLFCDHMKVKIYFIELNFKRKKLHVTRRFEKYFIELLPEVKDKHLWQRLDEPSLQVYLLWLSS